MESDGQAILIAYVDETITVVHTHPLETLEQAMQRVARRLTELNIMPFIKKIEGFTYINGEVVEGDNGH